MNASYVTRDGYKLGFREPRHGDAGELMRFINNVASEPMSGIVINREITLREEQAWLQERLKEIRAGSTVILLAEDGCRIIGNCHVSRLNYKESHRARIGIAIVKEWRGRGVGEVLMNRTIELVRERMHGVETIELSYLDYNKRASKLYEKLGFVKVATIPRSSKEGRKYYDEHVMILQMKRHRRSG